MRLHLEEYGDAGGAPVVCLHGLTGNGARFRKLGDERLAERRVVAPDLRGHGDSGSEPPWSREAHAGDVLETLDAAGVQRADWIGYSFGGLIAAAVAAAAPGRIGRLVLLEPALALPANVCLEYALAELEDQSFDSAEEAIEERLAGGMLFHTPREMLEEEMRSNLAPGDDGRLRYRYSRVAAVGAWGELAAPPPPAAGVPTLVVVAERSWLPVDAARYPDAEVVSVPGGHSVLWDAFDPTADAVARFLA
jgi:lipase